MQIKSTANTVREIEQLDIVKDLLTSSSGLSGNHAIVKQYEEDLSAYFGVKHAIAVSSGTAAIHASLAALNIKHSDKVIVPVTAAVMTCLPVLALGATPLFVDCAENSFAICPASLRQRLMCNPAVKAVVSVPMWGYPALSADIKDICCGFGIPIIEDAAQAIGTCADDRFEGTNGLIGCFSTHEIKMISTGEGGFVLTDDAKIASRIKTFARLGLNKDKSASGFGDHFGLNFKLNAMAAALGISELRLLDERIDVRCNNLKKWNNMLKEIEHIRDLDMAGNKVSINGYSLVKLFEHDVGDNLVAKSLYEYGFETDYIRYKYKLLPQYDIFKSYLDDEDICKSFPNAISLINRLIILPTHAGITDDHISYGVDIICKSIMSVLRKEYNYGS